MEVSRVNVVYFLSRNGRVEHPHLVRVHHHSRGGVRLRDVKRWLSEIRGKDMPDSFAWSYKRRYRSGYVWQDLMDDDLITPISDNEYVLKGSQILHVAPSTAASIARQRHFFSLDKEKDPKGAAGDDGDQKAEEQKETGSPPKTSSSTAEILPDVDDSTSPKPPPPPPPAMAAPDQECSSGASDESTCRPRKAVFKFDAFRERAAKEKAAAEMDNEGKGGGDGARIVSSSRSNGDGYPKRATEALWSILMCRDDCTDQGALRPIGRRWETARSSSAGAGVNRNDSSRKERSKSSGKGAKRAGEKGVHPATYNPAYMPNCSQCGKTFKPEKLHSHMKSCKGLRERVKNSKNNEKVTQKAEGNK